MLKSKLGLGVVFDTSESYAKNGFASNLEKRRQSIITSGPLLSPVILPLDPWSLERGRGVRLAIGHDLRWKRDGGLQHLAFPYKLLA